jgi:hypothetical protein
MVLDSRQREPDLSLSPGLPQAGARPTAEGRGGCQWRRPASAPPSPHRAPRLTGTEQPRRPPSHASLSECHIGQPQQPVAAAAAHRHFGPNSGPGEGSLTRKLGVTTAGRWSLPESPLTGSARAAAAQPYYKKQAARLGRALHGRAQPCGQGRRAARRRGAGHGAGSESCALAEFAPSPHRDCQCQPECQCR